VNKTAKGIWKIAGEKSGVFLSVVMVFVNPNTIVLSGTG
jgi:hypothetical protein